MYLTKAFLILVIFSVRVSFAQIIPPLYVGNIKPVMDEYQRIMRSSCSVELRRADDGIIRPPFVSGEAHPKNPLISSNSVGHIELNAMPNTGLFCIIFPYRPTPGTKMFARAYNDINPSNATFYADTFVGISPDNSLSSLVLDFGLAKPIDSGDDDSDGLNNSWERLLGIDDRLTPDYDRDGMTDYHEMLAGTAPDDPDSNLSFNAINPEFGGENKLRMKWNSVPGKHYQIQYIPNLIGEEEAIDVGEEILADFNEYEKEIVLVMPSNAVNGYFRVKLIIY